MSDTKTLYLVRHAKSDWHNNLSDFDRPLNKRGMRNAPEMGRRLQKRRVNPDTLICSPATRAHQTMERLAAEIGFPQEKIVFNASIYEASMGTLLSLIQEIDDQFSSAMIIGHNPGMSWLLSQLCGLRAIDLPTCAVAEISIPSTCWNTVGTDACTLLDLDYPKNTA